MRLGTGKRAGSSEVCLSLGGEKRGKEENRKTEKEKKRKREKETYRDS